MANTVNYDDLFNMSEISFMAGSDHEFVYNLYTSGCTPVDITGATAVWKLCQYGKLNTAVVNKTASLTGSPTNQLQAKLDAADTAGSSGKFIQIFALTDASGSVVIPGMGIINLLPFPS